MASRHFLGFNNSRDIPIRVKGGQFELHGLDPDVAVPFYFLDAKNELGATVEISGKSADAAPLVVHLQPCGKAVARFVDPEGKPHAKQSPAATFVLSPERIGAAGKHAPEVWADAEFMNYVDLEHYGRNQLTDDDGRFTFVALIPVATYKVALFNKTSSWDAKDFSVKSGETLQLPDIVIPDPAPKPTPNAAAEAKSEVIRAVEPVQKPQLRKEVDRKDIEPSGPRTIAKPENKTGKAGVALPGKAAVQGGGGFHLVRGNTTWIGSEGPPLVYDDYDKHFYISRGVHTVVLPKHTEGFGDFYGQRTLDPGVGRLDSGRVHPASGQSANIVIPRAIDLPAYQLLLQPSAQEALHL
jgi:hypothetical protein